MDNLSRRPVRLFFSKTGRAVYVSHLDVNRAMQRMLRRAKAPVWYTQGFNPHPYLVFHQPLSVGYAGRGEIMDFYLLADYDPQTLKAQLNAQMPPGFHAEQIARPQKELKDICYAGYTLSIGQPADARETLRRQLTRFLSAGEIITEKKSKKGVKLVDIKPLIAAYHIEDGAGERLLLKLVAACSQSQNLNPRTLIQAFLAENGEQALELQVTRTAFYDQQMKKFC